MIEMLSGTLRERGRCFRRLPGEREREAGVDSCRAVSNLHLCVRRSGVLGVEMKTLPVNPFFSNEKPGRRSQTELSERRLWKINFQKSRTSQRLESLFYSGILSGQRCGVSIQHLNERIFI